MKEDKKRDLTPWEKNNEKKKMKGATYGERSAFMLLPESMKKNAKRNKAVAFEGCNAYYPDIFLSIEKIVIEIDGSSHIGNGEEDAKRDEEFIERGYTVIRIEDSDTEVDVAFWQRLVEGLEKIENNRPEIIGFINDLQKLIDAEVRSWTDIYSPVYLCGEDEIERQKKRIKQVQKRGRYKKQEDSHFYIE